VSRWAQLHTNPTRQRGPPRPRRPRPPHSDTNPKREICCCDVLALARKGPQQISPGGLAHDILICSPRPGRGTNKSAQGNPPWVSDASPWGSGSDGTPVLKPRSPARSPATIALPCNAGCSPMTDNQPISRANRDDPIPVGRVPEARHQPDASEAPPWVFRSAAPGVCVRPWNDVASDQQSASARRRLIARGASAPGMASHPYNNPPRRGRWSITRDESARGLASRVNDKLSSARPILFLSVLRTPDSADITAIRGKIRRKDGEPCCARAGRARGGTRVPAVRALAPDLARGRLARARNDGRALVAPGGAGGSGRDPEDLDPRRRFCSDGGLLRGAETRCYTIAPGGSSRGAESNHSKLRNGIPA
jgi:hypothetical protein